MSEGRNPSGANLLLAFLAGAAVGAVVALLSSPKSGREMRESVGSWARRSGVRDAIARAVSASRDTFRADDDA